MLPSSSEKGSVEVSLTFIFFLKKNPVVNHICRDILRQSTAAIFFMQVATVKLSPTTMGPSRSTGLGIGRTGTTLHGSAR